MFYFSCDSAVFYSLLFFDTLLLSAYLYSLLPVSFFFDIVHLLSTSFASLYTVLLFLDGLVPLFLTRICPYSSFVVVFHHISFSVAHALLSLQCYKSYW